MATLAFVQPTALGVNPAFVACAGGGDSIAPNDHGYCHFRNGSGAPITVTLVVPGNTQFGQAQPDVAVSVPAGGDRIIGPLPAILADPSDGLIDFTYSGVTSLTVAAVSL